MEVALGIKAHSGWAVLVAVAGADGAWHVVDRHRVELVERAEGSRARHPYHAAVHLSTDGARDLIGRITQDACALASRELRSAGQRVREAGHRVTACAVLIGEPMPAWTIAEICAVHFRMHKAEGSLFRDALSRAVDACGMRLVEVNEKRLDEHAERVLATSAKDLRQAVAALGKAVGPPWGKDQKDAALAALIALAAPRKG